MEVICMSTNDNNALWDALMEQIDQIRALEYDIQELREQIANLRN